MLQVPETHVARARFPVIDFHTHITRSAKSTRGVSLASDRVYLGTPQELLAVMDSKNVRAMVNLTGGYDKGLGDVISKYDHALQDRFYSFTEPCYEGTPGNRLSATSGRDFTCAKTLPPASS